MSFKRYLRYNLIIILVVMISGGCSSKFSPKVRQQKADHFAVIGNLIHERITTDTFLLTTYHRFNHKDRSKQLVVYIEGDGMYLQGTASYSFNTNTGTRRILVGAVDRTASSAYDSGLFSIGVEAGWPTEDDGVTITPTAGLTFSTLSSDAYTETGAGNMNLTVTPDDVNTIEGKFGVKVTGKSVDADGGIGRPEVRVGVSHNFGDETADSTASFTAGGATFTTTGVKTDTTKVDIGLGYTYTTPEGDTEISVNADGRKSSSYVQFGGGLTVKWKF